MLRHPVTLTCAGRTDAGVHAWGQVVSFDTELAPKRSTPPRCSRSVNGLCGPAVVVRDVELAPDDFDARHSALSRCYRYTVLNRAVPDPFLAATTWHVPSAARSRGDAARVRPLHRGARLLVVLPQGARPQPGPHRALSAEWDDLGEGLLRFEIVANAFCQQMVRSIVGTLVEVGQGRKHAGQVGGDPAGAGPGVRGRRRAASWPFAVGGALSRPAAVLGVASRAGVLGRADGLAVNPRLARDSLDP